MSISPEAQKILDEEQNTLDKVLRSLREQMQYGNQRLKLESTRARALTSEIVAARRVEDKALLASDEAVSHGLKDQKLEELGGLAKMIAKPYFARLVVEEEINGALKEFEYKIGFAANTECRIIDWRKAPISKLYYEYRENDEYSEEIQGRERNGTVKLRNSVEIEKSFLKRVTCRYGAFNHTPTGWTQIGGSAREGRASGQLPSILSLITPDQFRLITEEASTAILIQGIAGSGKTTVALHRLAWLLHEDNSDLKAAQCVVIVFSSALKRYISGTLPSIDVSGVDIMTFEEWAARCVAKDAPGLVNEIGTLRRPADRPSSSVVRILKSLAVLRVLEEQIRTGIPADASPQSIILKTLSMTDKVVGSDETRLINRELVQQAYQRTKTIFESGTIDACADALLVRTVQLLRRGVNMRYGSYGLYGHIVADEVQDMSSTELACIIGAVKDTDKLTLVGDVAQQIESGSTFPGWEKLQKGANSKYISLSISHRSTLPIMKLADYVQERNLVIEGRPGRVPIWFRCKGDSSGVTAAIDWLNRALQKYPSSLTAVICADHHEAKLVLSLLRPTFGSGVRLGDDEAFTFEEGIIVTDCASAKGLEFTNVLIWNPTNRSYPLDQQSRNLLYIAISRAEENLCIVTWGRPSGLLPAPTSKLVRDQDLTVE